ncbi:MAG: hypothetical protein MI866_23280, partial [Bacteroidales bacterium]|nr:hypothetical protein [Bacteroidales bacterium]
GYEVVNERLVVKKNDTYVPDEFDDELVLVACENQKNLVLAGCAHTGIVNILHAVSERYGYASFDCVAGGLHLNGQHESAISDIINAVKEFEVKKWAINHCTGDRAQKQFAEAFVEKVVYFGTGAQLTV